MKVIAKVTLVGRDKAGNKVETAPGDLHSIDLPEEEARSLIARGLAAAVGKAEKAEAPKPAGKAEKE